MTRKNTTRRKSRTLSRALAALAVVVGAGLVSAVPAPPGGRLGVVFRFPFPVPAYEPPRYSEPAPEPYYEPPVVYAPPPVVYERPYYGHGYYEHHDRGWHRGWDHQHDGRGEWRGHDRDWDRD